MLSRHIPSVRISILGNTPVVVTALVVEQSCNGERPLNTVATPHQKRCFNIFISRRFVYVVDPARLMPPEVPLDDTQIRTTRLTHLLRPELVTSIDYPLSSD